MGFLVHPSNKVRVDVQTYTEQFAMRTGQMPSEVEEQHELIQKFIDVLDKTKNTEAAVREGYDIIYMLLFYGMAMNSNLDNIGTIKLPFVRRLWYSAQSIPDRPFSYAVERVKKFVEKWGEV